MSGWKDWAIGEVVTESDFQSFVQDQVVQRYTDATDRDNTLGANVATGMAAYLETEQLFQVYDGSAWVEISGSGTQISDTPPSDPDVGDTWWDSTNGKFYVYFDSYWVQVQLGEAGPQGESGVLAVTSPITYDAGTSTVGIDETAIAIDQDQVTGLANGTSGYSAVSDGSTLTYQPVSHNYIINGAFDIWQRGTSFTSGSEYTADRFYFRPFGGMNSTVSRQATGLDNFDYCSRVQRDSGDTTEAGLFFGTPLETNDALPIIGKEITISFYARKGADYSASTTDGLVVQLRTTTSDDENTIAIAGTATISETVTLTTSWQRFSVTGTVTDTVRSMSILFNYSGGATGTAGANDYYEVTGVQLEAGSVATPFKRNAPSLQGELAACQRYYQRLSTWFGFAEGTTAFAATLPFVTAMRNLTGSVSVISGATLSWRTPGASDSSTTSFSVVAPTMSTTGLWLLFTGLSGLTDNQAYMSRMLAGATGGDVVEVDNEL